MQIVHTNLEAVVGNSGDYSIRAAKDANLRYEDVVLLQKLDGFEALYLKEKLKTEGVFTTEREYREAFTEFKKFVALAGIYEDKISMNSEKVDAVWHQFILFTREYQTFCNDFLGQFLHHVPKTSFTPLAEGGKEKFVRLYQKTFGKIPKIWEIASESCSSCGEGCSSSGMCGTADD